MILRQLNKEVYFVTDPDAKVGHQDIEFLKRKAAENERKRVRVCVHKTMDDPVHEMILVLAKDAYAMPHKHLKKIESYHIIEGVADAIIFDEEGHITDMTRVGDYASRLMLYYRIAQPCYHTFLIRSDFLVFHETTNGPFEKSEMIPAPWAPEETDAVEVKGFMDRLARAAERFRHEEHT